MAYRFEAYLCVLAMMMSIGLTKLGWSETYQGKDWSLVLPAGWRDQGPVVANQSGSEIGVFYSNVPVSNPAAVKAQNPSKATRYVAEGPITIQGRRGFFLDYEDGGFKYRSIVLPAKNRANSYTIVCQFRPAYTFTKEMPAVLKVLEQIRFTK